jgi:hypothetical protein
LHVIAGFGERNLLDPVDRVDLGVARIAVVLDPLLEAAAPGVARVCRADNEVKIC